MKHLSEDALILHYYHEAPDAAPHLAVCEDCRRRFAELESFLSAVQGPAVPPRGDDYPAAVWGRVRPRIGERAIATIHWWQMPRRWAAVAAVAALVVMAFVAGRFYPGQKPQPAPPVASVQQVQERVLLIALGDHLDRSQMLLLELTHAPQARTVELSQERERADDLLAANRLYRQTAQRLGDRSTASVLDDLERLLIEVAHQPPSVTDAQLERIRQQIEADGLLFKVRIIRSNTLYDLRAPAQKTEIPVRPTT